MRFISVLFFQLFFTSAFFYLQARDILGNGKTMDATAAGATGVIAAEIARICSTTEPSN